MIKISEEKVVVTLLNFVCSLSMAYRDCIKRRLQRIDYLNRVLQPFEQH